MATASGAPLINSRDQSNYLEILCPFSVRWWSALSTAASDCRLVPHKFLRFRIVDVQLCWFIERTTVRTIILLHTRMRIHHYVHHSERSHKHNYTLCCALCRELWHLIYISHRFIASIANTNICSLFNPSPEKDPTLWLTFWLGVRNSTRNCNSQFHRAFFFIQINALNRIKLQLKSANKMYNFRTMITIQCVLQNRVYLLIVFHDLVQNLWRQTNSSCCCCDCESWFLYYKIVNAIVRCTMFAVFAHLVHFLFS